VRKDISIYNPFINLFSGAIDPNISCATFWTQVHYLVFGCSSLYSKRVLDKPEIELFNLIFVNSVINVKNTHNQSYENYKNPYIFTLVFHRILDFKQGSISMQPFLFLKTPIV